jgi:hypothetical protein
MNIYIFLSHFHALGLKMTMLTLDEWYIEDKELPPRGGDVKTTREHAASHGGLLAAVPFRRRLL